MATKRGILETSIKLLGPSIITILLLWVTLGCTAIWFVDILAIRILLVLIGAAVTVHILRFRTLSPEMSSCTPE